MKEEASTLFKKGKVNEALEKFKECLTLDPLNLKYNSVVYFNMAVGKLDLYVTKFMTRFK
jgi:hypothetical protein